MANKNKYVNGKNDLRRIPWGARIWPEVAGSDTNDWGPSDVFLFRNSRAKRSPAGLVSQRVPEVTAQLGLRGSKSDKIGNLFLKKLGSDLVVQRSPLG